jgi:hypothetical protein
MYSLRLSIHMEILSLHVKCCYSYVRCSWPLICLFVYLFWVARAIFQLSGDCHHCRWQDCKFRPMAFSSEGSFTCHTYCDTGPPFLRSYRKDPWFYLLNTVLLAKKQSLPILNVLGLTQPARTGLELTNYRLLSESTTTRLRQPFEQGGFSYMLQHETWLFTDHSFQLPPTTSKWNRRPAIPTRTRMGWNWIERTQSPHRVNMLPAHLWTWKLPWTQMLANTHNIYTV